MGRLRRSPIWSDPRVKPPYGSVEVNWGHPLATGLTACWLAAEGGGPIGDIAKRRALSTRGTEVDPTWVTASGGLGHRNTFRYYSTDPAAYNALNASALIVLDDRIDTGMLRTVVAGVWDGIDINQNSWRLQLDDSEVVLDSFVIAFNTGRSQFSNNIRLAGVHSWGFRMDNGSDSSTAYRDGSFVQAATEIAPYLTAGTPNAHPVLGAPASALNISMLATTIWERDLGDDYIRWATIEPYAFLRPILRRRYFVPAAAAARPGHGRLLAGERNRVVAS